MPGVAVPCKANILQVQLAVCADTQIAVAANVLMMTISFGGQNWL